MGNEKIKLIIADDNKEFSSILKEYFESQTDFIVLAPTRSIRWKIYFLFNITSASYSSFVSESVNVRFVYAARFLFGKKFDIIHFIEIIFFNYLGGLTTHKFTLIGFDEGGDDVARIEGVVVARCILTFFSGGFTLLQ